MKSRVRLTGELRFIFLVSPSSYFWVSHWLSHFTSFYQLLKRSFVYVFLRRSNISARRRRRDSRGEKREVEKCVWCVISIFLDKKRAPEKKRKKSSFFQHFRFAINSNSSKSRPPRCPASQSVITQVSKLAIKSTTMLIANWLFTNACLWLVKEDVKCKFFSLPTLSYSNRLYFFFMND